MAKKVRKNKKNRKPNVFVQDPSTTPIETKKIDPITNEKCPKCGHGKAYYAMVQTRAADEPETKFFKCEKCKHRWRDYG